ncbi:MAG: hypothetical protein KGY99_00030 [Phycisphaerae bacterium]|nr:hypothetical protein [Phycisphaerae bacterium]
MTLAATIRPAQDGQLLFAARITRVRQQIRMDDQTVMYDSAGPAADQHPALARALGPLATLRLTVLLNADGRVARARGLDAHWRELSERHLGDAALLDRLTAELSNAQLAAWFDRTAELLPPGPYAAGQRWQRRFTEPLAGVDVRTDLQFAATVDGAQVAISLEGTRSAEGDGEPVPNAASLKALDSTLTGRIVLDTVRSIARQMQVEEQGHMAYVADTPGGPVMMRIDQTVSTRVTVTPTAQPPQPGASDE